MARRSTRRSSSQARRSCCRRCRNAGGWGAQEGPRPGCFEGRCSTACWSRADAALLYYIITRRRAAGLATSAWCLVVLFGRVAGHPTRWRTCGTCAASPITTEGEILRKWQRAELIIAWQSYFIQIERKIFRVEARGLRPARGGPAGAGPALSALRSTCWRSSECRAPPAGSVASNAPRG